MNVKLTPHSEHLLREHLARGRYHTQEDVIDHALESLSEDERPAGRPRPTRDEFLAFLDALAEGSEKIPQLSSSAFSRESIYHDHP